MDNQTVEDYTMTFTTPKIEYVVPGVKCPFTQAECYRERCGGWVEKDGGMCPLKSIALDLWQRTNYKLR